MDDANSAVGGRTFYPAAIDGEQDRGSGVPLALVDPRTGNEFATSARCSAEDVSRAVDTALHAFDGWRGTPAAERGRLLATLSRLVRRDADRLARLESGNTGRRLSECHNDVEAAAQFFEFYGGLVAGVEGAVIEPSVRGRFVYQVMEPYGVTGHIIPWNAPLMLAARGIAPALAAGNTVVAKPAAETPITCVELERLAREAELPKGVFNVTPGRGSEAGEALAAHPRVPRITFTGSVETGRRVQQVAGPRMCHLTLELGGKSPNIIFADADLDRAVTVVASSITYGSGQVCAAGSRLLVAEEIHDDVVERVGALFRASESAQDEEERVAPLISAAQQSRVREYIERGVAEGATLASGGSPDAPQGFYVPPTLFTGVEPGMAIFREEIFGPVLGVTSFSDEDDAVRVANATEYGLAAGVWTESLRRALRVIPRIDVGMVYVNGYLNGGIESPVGGRRLSGIGVEKGRLALEAYLRTKTIAVNY